VTQASEQTHPGLSGDHIRHLGFVQSAHPQSIRPLLSFIFAMFPLARHHASAQ